MKVTKKIEKLENSAVKLTVTVGKEDVDAQYKDTVAKCVKNLQIPGFRKGKVPASILEQKYGEALRADAASELIEKALETVFAEYDEKKSDNRPLPYAQPAIDKVPELKVGEDLKFAVTYDVFPKVSVTDLTGIEIKEPQVKLSDADLKDELEAIRERNAMVIDRKDNEPAKKDDIVTVNYAELDDKGAEIEGSKRQDFVFTIGTEQNIYKFDNEIIGMKKNETKDIEKVYAEDFADKDLAGKTKKIRVTVTAIKIRDLPALDDELAQDVNEKYKTLDDMKADIKKNMESALQNKLKEIKSNELIEKLIEKYPFDLPKSMLDAELNHRWNMIAQQFQTTTEQLEKMITASGQKKEDMIAQWTGDAGKMLKGRIIVESLLKDRNISVTPEEIEAEYAKIAEGAGTTVEEVKKHYADATKKEYLIDDAKEQKLYAQLFSEIKVSKGEKLTFKELFNGKAE